MTPPLHRLRVGATFLGVIFVISVFGYCVAGWSLLDSLYMVVVTLSTVGYREVQPLTPATQVFTIIVIVVGVSTALYITGGFIQMTAEGEINRALGMRRITKEIDRLTDHVVLCGFGRMGEILAGELKRQAIPFVIIENDPDRIAEAVTQDQLAINDDATEEDALIHVGIKRAKTLVTTLPRDADNVFITLTARNLNPTLKIIARGEFPSTEKKLLQAGADRVVLPAATGAQRMAAMITRPSAVELIEVVAGLKIAEVEVAEMTIPAESELVGVTVRDSQTRSRHGLLIVAVRHPSGHLQFNPGADMAFQAGGSVVVMGSPKDIDRFRTEYRI